MWTSLKCHVSFIYPSDTFNARMFAWKLERATFGPCSPATIFTISWTCLLAWRQNCPEVIRNFLWFTLPFASPESPVRLFTDRYLNYFCMCCPCARNPCVFWLCRGLHFDSELPSSAEHIEWSQIVLCYLLQMSLKDWCFARSSRQTALKQQWPDSECCQNSVSVKNGCFWQMKGENLYAIIFSDIIRNRRIWFFPLYEDICRNKILHLQLQA